MRETKLLACLSSIAQQTYKDWECIIVDDNDDPSYLFSIPGFVEVVTNTVHRFRIVSAREHAAGFPVHNLGVRAAEGDLLFRLDDDVCLDPDFVEKAICGFSDHDVVAVGGCFKSGKRPFEHLKGDRGNFLYLDRTDLGLNLRYTLDVQLRPHKTSRWLRVDHIHSSYLYRRSAILEIGGFEESIRNGEETVPFVHWGLRKYKTLIYTGCKAEHITDDGGWRASKRHFPQDAENLQRILYRIYVQYRGYFPADSNGQRFVD